MEVGNGSRPDGRSRGEARGFELKCGTLSRSDGSARFKMNDTCVLASVYGPLAEQNAGKELSERARVEVVYFNAKGLNEDGSSDSVTRDYQVEKMFRQLFEKVIRVREFPRKQVRITLQVTNDGGSAIACALIACSAALIDAGVEMTSVPTGACCVVEKGEDSQILIDPVREEEDAPNTRATVFVCTADDSSNIYALKTKGVLSRDCLNECIKVCTKAASASRAFLRQSFKETETSRQAISLDDMAIESNEQ